MRTKILSALGVVVAGVALGATTASGGGISAGLSDGWDGVTSGNVRYVTVLSGRSTSVQAIDRQGGRVVRHMSLKGAWGLPRVAFDGTTEGLLPDGHTLLLAQPLIVGQTLRKVSSFALVDGRAMKLRDTISLRGAFAFDALSPDAHYMYLIEYISPEDPSLYRVRAYDLRRSKLLAKIVADRRSWETGMQGMPMARTWKDGWAYTLYGASARPFIHALDTRGVDAVCINMPWRTSPSDMSTYRLRTDGDGHLVVRGPRGRALVVVDRHSFRILSSVRTP